MSVNAKQSVSGTVTPGRNVRGAVGTGTVEVYSYYTPEVTQPDETTMLVEHIPSSKNMPSIEPVTLILPRGKDGADGETGPQGEPGYTPQKGVDYFTSDDISQVANAAADLVRDDIAAGIASAIGGSY